MTEVHTTYEAYSRLLDATGPYLWSGGWSFGGTVTGSTDSEVRERLAAAERQALDAIHERARTEQQQIDADLAQGKSYAVLQWPTVHTVRCDIVRPLLDRDAIMREWLDQIHQDEYPGRPYPRRAPSLYHRAEIESLDRTRKRCQLCAPDIENMTRRRGNQPGDVLEKSIRSTSLGEHHYGRELILADGTSAGTITAVHVAVTTTDGRTHHVPMREPVTLRWTVPDEPADP